MSHIHENISNYDMGIQALYNRVLVQMGMAAFRLGLIFDCHQYLQEICSYGKIRELLAQGISKYTQFEKEEKRRILPFHLHIGVEIVEAVYLISAMLLDNSCYVC